MDEDMKVESDAEKVAKTLETNVSARRLKRREYLDAIDGHIKEIGKLNMAIADLDRVIKVMEKSASKLRKG